MLAAQALLYQCASEAIRSQSRYDLISPVVHSSAQTGFQLDLQRHHRHPVLPKHYSPNVFPDIRPCLPDSILHPLCRVCFRTGDMGDLDTDTLNVPSPEMPCEPVRIRSDRNRMFPRRLSILVTGWIGAARWCVTRHKTGKAMNPFRLDGQKINVPWGNTTPLECRRGRANHSPARLLLLQSFMRDAEHLFQG
jgi:hypothetical protein